MQPDKQDTTLDEQETYSMADTPPSNRRPNVLFVITDQHRADHVGFMGNTVVKTPHLDALAERGTVFENAWVSNPVCMPNRSCLLYTSPSPRDS